MGNVSRVLFRKRELTEFCAKLSETCEELGEFPEASFKPIFNLKGFLFVKKNLRLL